MICMQQCYLPIHRCRTEAFIHCSLLVFFTSFTRLVSFRSPPLVGKLLNTIHIREPSMVSLLMELISDAVLMSNSGEVDFFYHNFCHQLFSFLILLKFSLFFSGFCSAQLSIGIELNYSNCSLDIVSVVLIDFGF